MMLKEIIAFSGKKYKPQYDWNSNAYNAEDGKTLISKGKAFFEIYIDNILFRGDGADLQTAESNARKKYIIYTKCDHNYIRVGKTGLAKCTKCNVKKSDYFENILNCHCGKKANYVYKYCYEHYIESFENKINENEDNTYYIFKKNIIKYLKKIKLSDSEIEQRDAAIEDYMCIYSFFKENCFKDMTDLKEKNEKTLDLIEKMQRNKEMTEYWVKFNRNEIKKEDFIKKLIGIVKNECKDS